MAYKEREFVEAQKLTLDNGTRVKVVKEEIRYVRVEGCKCEGDIFENGCLHCTNELELCPVCDSFYCKCGNKLEEKVRYDPSNVF